MATSIFHGVKTNLLTSGALAITTVATAVIGLVATSSDADAATFPLDRPVLITDVRGAIAKAGKEGTLAATLTAIATICSPQVIVVRVATNPDATQQAALVAGTSVGGYTGVQALLMAEQLTGSRPRILGTPGLTDGSVITSLVSVAKSLRSMVYAKVPDATTRDAAVTEVADYGDMELMAIWPNTSGLGPDVEARALAMRAYIDATKGWHKTLSNVVVPGVTGLEHDVSWTMDGASSDAGVLNNANITTMYRRNGWRFWGNRTCSSEPFYAFESAVRTSQVLADTIEQAVLDRATDEPITDALVRDLLASINAAFRKMKTQRFIMGANAYFDPALNTADQLAAGQLTISYDFTPCAPAEGTTLNQTITSTYYADFASLLQAA
ncbi:phage tail sheath subtilisin-like domain-containing protein [Novosphingobium rosa]|uniref:phage tail sheath subtilisin-like domain-containing protein n=1 Tax=Novosphingobium rosa TaxID=76978 RepID=UPI000832E93F|nr:phage tail sheath subtilisin-like domain-containing protein [Novosphingobium rosa]